MTRCFAMCKPGVLNRRLVGQVITRLENKGLKLVGLKLMNISKELASKHYAEHQGKPFYDELGIDSSNYALLEEILKPRITRLTQITEKLQFLKEYSEFELTLFEHKKSKSTLETSKAILGDVIPLLAECSWDRETITDTITGYAAQKEYKNALVMWPVRIAAAGVAVTPGGCAEVLLLLGKDESMRRLNEAYNRLG